MQLVTGHTGTEHVKSAQAGAMHAGIVGTGTYVLGTGSKLAATMLNANTVSIADGDLMIQGRHCSIAHGETDELTVQNGTQAQKRNDLVVARYEKLDTEPRTESVTLRVIKGAPSDGEAEDPEYQDGDIRAGDLVVEAPLYRIRLDGITVSDPEPMVDVLVPMADLWDSVSQSAQVVVGSDVWSCRAGQGYVQMWTKEGFAKKFGRTFDADADFVTAMNGDAYTQPNAVIGGCYYDNGTVGCYLSGHNAGSIRLTYLLALHR